MLTPYQHHLEEGLCLVTSENILLLAGHLMLADPINFLQPLENTTRVVHKNPPQSISLGCPRDILQGSNTPHFGHGKFVKNGKTHSISLTSTIQNTHTSLTSTIQNTHTHIYLYIYYRQKWLKNGKKWAERGFYHFLGFFGKKQHS